MLVARPAWLVGGPAAGWQLKAADRGGQVLSIDLSEDRERLPTAADFVVPDTPF